MSSRIAQSAADQRSLEAIDGMEVLIKVFVSTLFATKKKLNKKKLMNRN